MFPCRRADVWLTPETYLLKYPDGKDNYTPEIWTWLMAQNSPVGFLEKEQLPWMNAPQRHFALIAAPILDSQSGKSIGGMFIELLSLPQSWKKKTIRELYPAVQNLADQIAAALKQAEVYQETMNHQRVTQELRLAGEIQTSFLPIRSPEVAGWDIAASLEPARQTSGDFYDFFALEDGRLGILIADVADKGLGAALYMALGRTLLLTYAQEYPENPAAVLRMTNQRMLSDARARMFITAFYGVLEPEIGRLIYCNAGHNPPILLNGQKPGRILELSPNGMALGIDPDATWVAVSRQIEPEDTLLLYTDGVVEANDPLGGFYGMARLHETVNAIASHPSQWIIRAIQEDVVSFQDGTSQSDDITLMCIKRRE
jgi:sigma-B regulation protein RsbU (phosphoserine phosphatase)